MEEQEKDNKIKLELEIEKPEAQEEEYKDKFMRVLADFENYKKRMEREKEELSFYLKGEILKSFFPVLDDLEQCMMHKDNQQSMNEGIELIRKKLETAFEQNGLRKIPSVGEKFDHNVHEAVMTRDVESPDLDDKVIEEIQSGYTLNDKLLRPAKVIVGKYNQ